MHNYVVNTLPKQSYAAFETEKDAENLTGFCCITMPTSVTCMCRIFHKAQVFPIWHTLYF